MGFFGSMDLCQQMYQMSRKTKYSFVKGDQVCKKIIVYLAQKMNPRLSPEEQLQFAFNTIINANSYYCFYRLSSYMDQRAVWSNTGNEILPWMVDKGALMGPIGRTSQTGHLQLQSHLAIVFSDCKNLQIQKPPWMLRGRICWERFAKGWKTRILGCRCTHPQIKIDSRFWFAKHWIS